MAADNASRGDTSRGNDAPPGDGWRSRESNEPRTVPPPRGRLATLVHRLLHREDFEKEQVLLDLIEDLGRCRSEKELAEELGRGLSQVYGPSAIHVFLRRRRRFRLVYSTDRPLEPVELAPLGLGILEVEDLGADDEGPARQDRDTPQEPIEVAAASELSADERSWLGGWSADWIVPLVHPLGDWGLLGVVLMGKTGMEITAVHRDLLRILGERLAVHWADQVRLLEERLLAEQGKGRWLKECGQCHRCFDVTDLFCPDDDTVLDPTILLDRTIRGRYRLDHRLGRGGMGSVYRAHDLRTGEDVAIKILAGGDRVAHGRFENEARAGMVVRHPNITHVIESGPLGKQGAFMAMEYVEGRTLREVFDAEMPIDPPRLARWFDQVFDGVATAHENGVIHRDLKPDNMMLVQQGGEEVIKVLDFGLAKLRNPSAGGHMALTAAGMVIGTLSYMSPEQLAADADQIDGRTDMFSLGVMITEALTGKLPFYASNLGEMLRAVATQPFRLEVETLAQARVADVLGKALAKAPAARYPDVATFRAELIPALEQCQPFVRE